MESVDCDSLDKHLTGNEVLHKNQWGFKKGISTELLLLYLTEALDLGYKIGILFVDFKKAFDTVHHTVLKSKLLAAGVSGPFYSWLVSFIAHRSRYTIINGVKSTLRIVDISVPQGSLLGPRLFAIYVNDLIDATLIGYIHMFADDTTMYYTGKKVEEIIDMLNVMLNNFYHCCERNRLTVHTGKMESMLISVKPLVDPIRPLPFRLSFINFTTKTTCLGIEIGNTLTWKPQIDSVAGKFSGKFKFLKKIKNLPVKILEEIYL